MSVNPLPDIEFGKIIDKKGNETPYVDSHNSMYYLEYQKTEEYFSNIDSHTKFLNAVEKEVRQSDRYSAYKKYLINEAGLDHCQVFLDVTNEDAEIEMHHGPIFTLFDYASIILEYFLQHHYRITTFLVADELLKEHEENHIQVVMLSSTIHQEVHARNLFISVDQAFGDLNAFISKYNSAIGRDLREKYNKYLDRCMVSKSNDFGLLTMNTKVWKPGESQLKLKKEAGT